MYFICFVLNISMSVQENNGEEVRAALSVNNKGQ